MCSGKFSLTPTFFFILAAELPLLTLAGCSREPVGDPSKKLIGVSGKISVEGKPARLGTVLFFPANEADTSEVSKGKINQKGAYRMSPDVPPGRYRVVVEISKDEKYRTVIEVVDDPNGRAYEMDLKKEVKPVDDKKP